MTAVPKKTNNDNNFISPRSLFPVERKKLSPEELKEIENHFPSINPQAIPNGNRVLIQIRAPREKVGSIYVPDNIAEEQLYQEQIGKVIAIGASCFHSQQTMNPWPEGEWFGLGDFVRVPKFGGDKQWTREDENGRKGLFVFFRDFEVIATVLGNPLDIKGYV